jgi:hypothetical protein
MSVNLLETALRVLTCYTGAVPLQPKPEDVAQLRSAPEASTRVVAPDVLAVETIHRELKRSRASAAPK